MKGGAMLDEDLGESSSSTFKGTFKGGGSDGEDFEDLADYNIKLSEMPSKMKDAPS
jgi:hypothetical protein